jgi:hypothetical protein
MFGIVYKAFTEREKSAGAGLQLPRSHDTHTHSVSAFPEIGYTKENSFNHSFLFYNTCKTTGKFVMPLPLFYQFSSVQYTNYACETENKYLIAQH